MPAAIAIPLITAAASTGVSLVGAKMASNSAKRSQTIATDSANHAADVAAQSAREALEFQRQQADRDQQNFNTTERANYDQWAAGSGNEYSQYVSSLKNDRNVAVAGGHNDYNKWSARDRRIGKLGEMLGLGQRETPAYEEIAPLDIPTLNTPAYAGPGRASAKADPKTQAAIRAELQRSNSSDDPEAWDNYVASHGDSVDKNWAYWVNRIRTGDGVGKGYRGSAAALLG